MNAKKNATYFLIRDILSCFPDKVEERLVPVLRNNLISKDKIRDISLEEIKEKRPNFRILSGTLIIHNNFLRQMQRVAFYETTDILDVIEYCFKKDKRKTLNRLSAETILRLFASLYYELIFLPLSSKDKSGLEAFKKTFLKEDIIKAIFLNDFYTRYIFENYGMKLGTGDEVKKRLKEILNQFYK